MRNRYEQGDFSEYRTVTITSCQDPLVADLISMSATEGGLPSANEMQVEDEVEAFEIDTGIGTMRIHKNLEKITEKQ